MKEIRWRDEKLYRIAARDYGDAIHRGFGVIANSISKGTAIAVVVVVILLSPRLLTVFGKDWYKLFLPLVLVCAIGSAIRDYWSYTREIEIRSDQLVGHCRGKSAVVGIREVREISEGRRWTLFGWVHGLLVRGKGTSIFIPAGCADYAEIKSRLNAWHPAAI